MPGALWGFHGVLSGLWGFPVAVEEVSLGVLPMNSESFLPSMVRSWLTEQFLISVSAGLSALL